MDDGHTTARDGGPRPPARTVGRPGERVTSTGRWRSAAEYGVYLGHRCAYDWACPFCTGASVVEVGCGSGYGALLVSQVATVVRALDVDRTLVHQLEPLDRPNVTFEWYDGRHLPVQDQAADVCICFQVLEHVPDPDRFLRELRRVVRPGGVVLLTTPNAEWRLLPGQRPWNPYHLREYRADELRALLERHFASCDLYAQSSQRPTDGPWHHRRRTRLLKVASRLMPACVWRALLRGAGALLSLRRGLTRPLLTEDDLRDKVPPSVITRDLDRARCLAAVCRRGAPEENSHRQ